MSKFNSRVLFSFPQIQPLQSFKDSCLTLLTSFQHTILQILKTLSHQFERNPQFRNMVFIFTILSIVITILKWMGKRKNSFYRKQGSSAAEINKCTQSVKMEIDVMRKYILKYLGEEGSVVGDNKSVEILNVRREEMDSIEIEKKFENLKNVLELYQYCVKSNNKFNEYFLDEFVKVFAELKELRKSKGVRGSSKRKDGGEVKIAPVVEKQREREVSKSTIMNGVVPHIQPKISVSSIPVTPIVLTPTVPSVPSAPPTRNGPRVPPSSKPPTKKPPQPTIKPIIQSYTQTQDQGIIQFNNSQQINHSSSPFDEPFNNPYTDQIPTTSSPIDESTAQLPIPQASQLRAEPQNQIPDDPILSIPSAPTSIKHSLPTLPIKPKQQPPPMGGRRPPPPPRKL